MIKLSHNLGWLHNFRTFPCPHGLDFEKTIEAIHSKGVFALEFFPTLLEFSHNLKRIKNVVEKNHLYFYSGHLPMMGGVLSDDSSTREYLWKYMEEWLETFAELGITTAVAHPDDAYFSESELAVKIENLLKYADFLGKVAQKYNMKIAVETLWEKGQLFTKIEELEYFKKNLPRENVGFCFDTGHVFGTSDNRCWKNPQKHLEDVFMLIKDNIYNFHVHDTDVNSDKHLPLGEGSIDFEKLFRLIKNMQPDFPITIEISPRHIGGKINSLNIDDALDNLYKTFWKFIDR